MSWKFWRKPRRPIKIEFTPEDQAAIDHIFELIRAPQAICYPDAAGRLDSIASQNAISQATRERCWDAKREGERMIARATRPERALELALELARKRAIQADHDYRRLKSFMANLTGRKL